MHSSPGGSGEEQRIPRLAPGWDPSSCTLTPAEGFLLSRIDGHTPWSALRQIGGIAPEEVDGLLERWVKEGFLLIGGSDLGESAPAAAAGKTPEASVSDEVDAALDISVELQERILEFEGSLERSYHELLGVNRKATAKDIKLAYFRLSKEYHPDRYFRREIGTYAQRLDRIFKRVCEAYELLSDPTTRAEIERTMIEVPEEIAPPEEGAYGGAGGSSERIGPDPKKRRRPAKPVDLRMRNLQRLRARFKVPKKALVERQFKAKQFYRSALAAAHEKRWLEAAASMRLAIAFDPASPEYKSGFAEIQADVHRVRAEQAIEQADSAEAQVDALRMLEEALAFRPLDVKANRKAAELCLDLREFDKAREYADTLCEVEPEEAASHVLLARVFRSQGLRKKAREILDRATELDPNHPDLAAELAQLRKHGRR